MTVTTDYSRSRSQDLIDQLAHDAGVAKDQYGRDIHVKGVAMTKTAQEMRTEKESVPHALFGEVEDHKTELAEWLIEKGVHHVQQLSAAQGLAYVAGGAFVLGLANTERHLYEKAIEEPAEKSDALAAMRANDVINVAVTNVLAYDKAFQGEQARERSEVAPPSVAAVECALKGKDAAMIPVLQARSDAGTRAAIEMAKCLKSVPVDKQRAAIKNYLAANGLDEKRKNDLAFGKGFEYGMWLHSHPAKLVAEEQKMNARSVPPSTFVVSG